MHDHMQPVVFVFIYTFMENRLGRFMFLHLTLRWTCLSSETACVQPNTFLLAPSSWLTHIIFVWRQIQSAVFFKVQKDESQKPFFSCSYDIPTLPVPTDVSVLHVCRGKKSHEIWPDRPHSNYLTKYQIYICSLGPYTKVCQIQISHLSGFRQPKNK